MHRCIVIQRYLVPYACLSTVCLYCKKTGTSKISLAVYRINIIIRTVCHRQRQRGGGEVGRVQATILLNTEAQLFESCLKSYFYTNIYFVLFTIKFMTSCSQMHLLTKILKIRVSIVVLT